MKLNIELYLQVDFLRSGVSLKEVYNRNGKRNTYGYSRLLVVLNVSNIHVIALIKIMGRCHRPFHPAYILARPIYAIYYTLTPPSGEEEEEEFIYHK